MGIFRGKWPSGRLEWIIAVLRVVLVVLAILAAVMYLWVFLRANNHPVTQATLVWLDMRPVPIHRFNLFWKEPTVRVFKLMEI